MHRAHKIWLCISYFFRVFQLTEELPIPSSDEEPDEVPAVDSEDELSDSSIKQEDLEGSVDVESARSDEGYEDLAPFDEQDGDKGKQHSLNHDTCSFNMNGTCLKSHTFGKHILNETSLQSE